MTNQQILEKAISKAIDGGWRFDEEFYKYEVWTDKVITFGDWWVSTYEIIFSHDFAKVLWPTKTQEEFDNTGGPLQLDSQGNLRVSGDYKFHLQRMVIAEDPIKYLGENLND